VMIKLRKIRVPQRGDKQASRYAQKATGGSFVDQADMPYDVETGISPDVLFNPHAMPTRMTFGDMVEKVFAWLAGVDGRFQDATPFRGNTVEETTRALTEAGFHYSGRRTMVCGRTGALLTCDVFSGVTYLQTLKHQAAPKLHARVTGPRDPVTHQPVEGRKREGGLRFGPMEVDATVGHGVPHVIHNLKHAHSDGTMVPVCKTCSARGSMMFNADYGASVRGRMPFCVACGGECALVPTSHAWQVMQQNLEALHLRMDMVVTPRPMPLVGFEGGGGGGV